MIVSRRCRSVLAVGLMALLFIAARAVGAEDQGEALREAARAGDLARVDALLAAGVPVDAPARYSQTPLYFAAEKGQLAVAKRLVERGADVNAEDSFFGASVLGMALSGGYFELARHLLAHGAEDAASALGAAIDAGDLDLARAALATGFLEPLDLVAARRQLEEQAKQPSEGAEQGGAGAGQALRELLATASAKPRQRPPYKAAPEKLSSYAGRYRGQSEVDTVVAVRGEGLGITLPGQPEMAVAAVEEGRFDSAGGDFSVVFGGRGGTVEWARVNKNGELSFLGVVTSDPAPLRTATTPGTEAGAKAPRSDPRPWPQFRGPGASGVGDGQGAPAAWNVTTGEGVRFKTAIPGIGLSSPIVWGDKIFLTTAVSGKGDTTFRTGLYGDTVSVDDVSEHSFRLYALDAGTGRVLWDREVHHGVPQARRHLKSSLANATPATDGEHIVVLFGPVGKLAVYDFQGKQLWQRDIGILDTNDPQSGTAEWGHASSPILYGDLVLVQGDRRKDSFLAAYRLATGEEAWRIPRDEPSSWSTPNILPAPSGDELITNGQTIRAYEPRTGRILWTLGPNSEVIVATPIIGDGLAFVTAGYPPVRPVYAVRPGHRGDLSPAKGERTSKAVAWSHPRGGTYIPSPILYRGILYTCNNNGILTAYKAETGEQLSIIRLNNAGAAFSASPVAADGRLYIASESGDVYVLRAAPEPELLEIRPMGETLMSTPAISGGLMIVRTLSHVYGLAEGAKAAPAPEAPAR